MVIVSAVLNAQEKKQSLKLIVQFSMTSNSDTQRQSYNINRLNRMEYFHLYGELATFPISHCNDVQPRHITPNLYDNDGSSYFERCLNLLVYLPSDDGVDIEERYSLARVDSVIGTVGDGVPSLSLKF